MIDCAAYRRALLADPRDPDPGLREHRGTCHDCTAFTERLMRFESRLGQALRVAAPSAKSRAARGRSWLALAASVLLAVLVAGGLWLSVPDRSLAADVVAHMQEEPQAWRRTDVPVPGPALADVLRDSHLRLAPGAGLVSYANSCGFRGRVVPHLVMQTASGPVTVMVLIHEHSSKPVQFDEQGYRGVIVPIPGHGSLAVLTRGPDTDPKTIQRIAAQVQSSIVWTG
jgi:hypothetical protein